MINGSENCFNKRMLPVKSSVFNGFTFFSKQNTG